MITHVEPSFNKIWTSNMFSPSYFIEQHAVITKYWLFRLDSPVAQWLGQLAMSFLSRLWSQRVTTRISITLLSYIHALKCFRAQIQNQCWNLTEDHQCRLIVTINHFHGVCAPSTSSNLTEKADTAAVS